MVRFARIKGVHAKSSFNKVPEEASTWDELKKPISPGSPPEPEISDKIKTPLLPKKVHSTWSEFEPECKEPKKKKNKQSVGSDERFQPKKKSKLQESLNLVESTYEHKTIKKKLKNNYSEQEVEHDSLPITDDERAKKLQLLKENLKKQGKDDKDIFGLNEVGVDSASMGSGTKNKKRKLPNLENNANPNGKIHKKDTPNPEDTSKISQRKKKTRKEKELEGLDFKRRKPDSDESLLCIDGVEIKLEKFDGYLVSEERAKKLTQLRQKLKEEGRDEKDIFGIVKLERRKAEKELKSLKKRMCFHCRKGGHNLSDCPELSSKAEQPGICFKCGSTEHRLNQCKSKSKTLEFATCFICNEKGHLSRECTNNPRGLYPDGGGCKNCGDVTHYVRDCPKGRKNKEVVSAKRIVFDDPEALDYDEEILSPKKPSKISPTKRPNKIIKFD